MSPRERGDEEEDDLVAIAKAVSDGQPVDWDNLQEEDTKTKAVLEGLQFVAEIAEAHRRMLDADESDLGPAGTTAAPGEPSQPNEDSK